MNKVALSFGNSGVYRLNQKNNANFASINKGMPSQDTFTKCTNHNKNVSFSGMAPAEIVKKQAEKFFVSALRHPVSVAEWEKFVVKPSSATALSDSMKAVYSGMLDIAKTDKSKWSESLKADIAKSTSEPKNSSFYINKKAIRGRVKDLRKFLEVRLGVAPEVHENSLIKLYHSFLDIFQGHKHPIIAHK